MNSRTNSVLDTLATLAGAFADVALWLVFATGRVLFRLALMLP